MFNSDNEACVTVTNSHVSCVAGAEGNEDWLTCHIREQEYTTGFDDGSTTQAKFIGTVRLEMILPDGSTKGVTLNNVLLHAEALFSMSKAFKFKKTTKFSKFSCDALAADQKTIVFTSRSENLYYFEYCRTSQQVYVVKKGSTERLWHHRFGHFGEQSLKILASKKMVEHFDYDTECSIGFCEACEVGNTIKLN